jgi:hypothetical protein
MSARETVQYTLRHVPKRLDRALRQRRKKAGGTLNQIAIETLERGLKDIPQYGNFHDLDSLSGTWQEDKAFDAIIEANHQIEKKLWE